MAPPTPLLDPTQAHLATVSGDGRLKVFGVASQRLTADLTPALSGAIGASGPSVDIITSISWGTKGRIAVGTASGTVKAVDSASASQAWNTTPTGLEGGVAGLAHSPDARQLLVVGRVGGAAVLDAATGAGVSSFQGPKGPLTAVSVLSGGRALISGTTTSLIDMSSGSQLATWTPHASPLVALAVVPGEAHLATAGQGERSAAVWLLASGRKGRAVRFVAAATLALRAPALALSAAGVQGREGSVAVAALLQDGSLEVFVTASMPAKKGLPAVQAVRVAATGRDARVLSATIKSADASGCTLLLASGPAAKPHFQTQHVAFAKDGTTATVIPVSSDESLLVSTSAAVVPAAPAGSGGKRGVSVVGVTDVAQASVATPAVAGSKRGAVQAVEGSSEEDEPMPEAMEGSEDDEVPAGDAGVGGPTLGERLAALQVSAGTAPRLSSAPGTSLPARPSAGSLSTLLSQALRSGDKDLLERCLAVRQERVVAATLRALAPTDAALLLRALVARLGASPARGEALAAWVGATLRCHAGSLIADPGMQSVLGRLHQAVEARLATYQPLLSLAGRLDLVLAQAQAAQRSQAGGEAPASAPVRVQLGEDGSVAVEEVYAGDGVGEGSTDESGSEEEDEEDDLLPNGLDDTSEDE